MEVHSAIDEAADGAKEMLQELIDTLEQVASAAGIVTNMVDTISRSIARVRPVAPPMAGRCVRVFIV